MLEEKLDEVVLEKLSVQPKATPDLAQWIDFLNRYKNPHSRTTIALIGKYVELKDSYKSIAEAFIHAGAANEVGVDIRWIHSEDLTPKNAIEKLQGVDGILVAPGFGSRGMDGKLEAIRYARESKIPFFGICLGMQMAVVEFARNVLGFADAHSTEMKEYTAHPVISLMAEQKTIMHKGGTMRLGSYPCKLTPGSKAAIAYGNVERIEERHRHRFEFNSDYKAQFEAAGMRCTGINPDSGLVEIIELSDHPYFLAAQFHPEYKSTVMNPHPLFVSFVQASKVYHEAHHAKSHAEVIE
jgi:CTP synthase